MGRSNKNRFAQTSLLFAILTSLMPLFQNCGQPFQASGEKSLASSLDGPIGGTPSVTKTCTTASPFAAVLPQRLTPTEYSNVIRDLFGGTKSYASLFSGDPLGDTGFSTDATGQTISPLTVAEYWTAALEVVTDVQSSSFFSCTSGDACATELLTGLANRAYRRPAAQAEIKVLTDLYTSAPAGTFKEKMRGPILAVLMSPNFIFRYFEKPASTASIVSLSNYQLASKISFFIWGSIPDAELISKAADGTLTDSAVLEAQVRRMLQDQRTSYLVGSFGVQWLGLAKFDDTMLDTDRFPDWTPALQTAMRTETNRFLRNVFVSNASVKELITGEYSFLNNELADHYGVNAPSGAAFSKVAINDGKRRGLLTQGSILAMTSGGDHTTPVNRGYFVLDKILCSPPPPAPATAPPLEEVPEGNYQAESQIRERLAGHAKKGSDCIGCHQAMDPIGFSFENYDSSGAFRTKYVDNVPVDASGQLPSGEKVVNLVDLSKVIEKDARFPACFSAKLATFAQGRNMTSPEHRCYSQAIAAKSIAPDKGFAETVVSIVTSPEFLNRKVDN